MGRSTLGIFERSTDRKFQGPNRTGWKPPAPGISHLPGLSRKATGQQMTYSAAAASITGVRSWPSSSPMCLRWRGRATCRFQAPRPEARCAEWPSGTLLDRGNRDGSAGRCLEWEAGLRRGGRPRGRDGRGHHGGVGRSVRGHHVGEGQHNQQQDHTTKEHPETPQDRRGRGTAIAGVVRGPGARPSRGSVGEADRSAHVTPAYPSPARMRPHGFIPHDRQYEVWVRHYRPVGEPC